MKTVWSHYSRVVLIAIPVLEKPQILPTKLDCVSGEYTSLMISLLEMGPCYFPAASRTLVCNLTDVLLYKQPVMTCKLQTSTFTQVLN